MERIVHICNGDATADTLSLAELPGELRVWADTLDQGPVLPVDDREYHATRAAYHASRNSGDSPTTAAAAEHERRLADWDRGVDTALAAEEVILWFEHDLFDQLALVRLLARIARIRGANAAAAPAQISMVSIDRHPDVASFVGLGQLQPEQLAALWPSRVPIGRDAFDEAVAAWVAVTTPDPRALPFLIKRVKALPFLAGAIERHLEELPDAATGLSRTERQLLAAVARGTSATELVSSLHAIDPRYPITDVVLADTIRNLRRAELLDAASGAAGAANLAITSLGRQVLAGATDRVKDRGIDTWRGGVRLSGRGPVWRWEARERRLFEK